MASNTVDGIERSVHKAYEWLAELCDLLGIDDRADAYRRLRAFLHLLRDRVTVTEAADFAAQLPMVLRGLFFEGWKPDRTPQTWRTREEFLARLAEAGGLAGPTESAYTAGAVARLLRHQLTEGQVTEIFSMLPAQIAEILDAPLPSDIPSE